MEEGMFPVNLLESNPLPMQGETISGKRLVCLLDLNATSNVQI
jgi:hypothetical protein